MPSQTSCRLCQSEDQSSFPAEIALHFRGLKNLGKPIVWVFPDVSVCLNCGTAEFKIPERELQVLRTGTPVDTATVTVSDASEEVFRRGAEVDSTQTITHVKTTEKDGTNGSR